jgi:hypothetical protein
VEEERMATKRRAGRATGSGDVRAFTVVLEQIHVQMKVFGEGFAGLRERVDGLSADMARQFAEAWRRFDLVDLRFEHVDERFGGVEERLDRLEHEVSGLEHEMAGVKT